MLTDETRRRELAKAAAELLEVLAAVARRAREKLAAVGAGRTEQILASGTNPMVDGNRAGGTLGALLARDRGQLERLGREPYVARLAVEWADQPDSPETIYVTRASAAGLPDAVPDGRLVTYTAALGRLAEFPAGETTTVTVGGRPREARICERIRLRPERQEEEWDGLDDRFEFSLWEVSLESLRAALAQLRPDLAELDLVSSLREAAAAEGLARKTLRRRVINRISLRDQPILNRYQGEIFRIPLDQRLLLLGPPGTGKTTTLIRRLAQKRTPEALSEDEVELLSATGLEAAFAAPESWVMFSPTDLLSLYLGDAFTREGVPAVHGVNLRTWEKERLELARNVLEILRSAESGVFVLDDTAEVLVDGSSEGISQLFDDFAVFAERTVIERASTALGQLERSAEGPTAEALRLLRRNLAAQGLASIRDLVRLAEAGSEILQPEIRRLDHEIRAEGDRCVNRLLASYPALLDDLARALPGLTAEETPGAGEEGEEEEEEAEGDLLLVSRDAQIQAFGVLLSAVRTAARAAASGRPRVGGRAGRVLDLLGERQPQPNDLLQLGVLMVTRGRLRMVRNAPRDLVFAVPKLYAAFRRKASEEGRLFRDLTVELIRQNRITRDETDVLILLMLRNARAFTDERHGASPEWLEAISSLRLAQVFVDEATDFSAVQLACTLELADPRLRSWFACGDLLQRVTPQGLRDISEVEWITRGGPGVEIREVHIGYRQALRLRELAAALVPGRGSVVEPPEGEEDADVWPLLAEGHTGQRLGSWLADRILDVERAVGHLPSIAVFVDGEESIDEVVATTRPALGSRNVSIVGCKAGRDVGDAQEVRVFDVRHIKGLEFEAVFFVGVDRLAERLPDLFDRYLYVGVTRAATYLGITCEASLPARLERVRTLMGEATTNPW